MKKRSYYVTRHTHLEVTRAEYCVEAALRCAREIGDRVLDTELTRALAHLRTANTRAFGWHKNEALREAKQIEAFE